MLHGSGPIRPMPRVIFRGKPGKDIPGRAGQHCAVSCAKMAEPIEMPFGLWTRVGTRKHVLGKVYTGATWPIRLNRLCAAAMRPFCQVNLTTCFMSIATKNADQLMAVWRMVEKVALSTAKKGTVSH